MLHVITRISHQKIPTPFTRIKKIIMSNDFKSCIYRFLICRLGYLINHQSNIKCKH